MGQSVSGGESTMWGRRIDDAHGTVSTGMTRADGCRRVCMRSERLQGRLRGPALRSGTLPDTADSVRRESAGRVRFVPGGSGLASVRMLVPALLLMLLLPVAVWSMTVEEMLEQARQAAHTDDHVLAIRLYRDIVQADPAMRDSVSAGLASQLTWAGLHEEAVDEFLWILERQPNRIDAWRTLALAQSWSGDTAGALRSYARIRELDPQDREARLGEARMNSWLGRSTMALRQYEGLVDEDPGDRQARLGLAQLHNWRGDHRRAWRMYEAILLGDSIGAGSGPWEGLALARNWAGRADLALDALDVSRSLGLESESSARLGSEIRRQWPGRIAASSDWSRDSDDFSSVIVRLETEAPLRYSGRIRVGFIREWFDQPGQRSHTDIWLRASGDYRPATFVAARAAMSVCVDPPARSDHTPVHADVGASLLPADRWKLDLTYSRFTIFTYPMFPTRVTADMVGGSLDFRPHYLTTVIVNADRVSYSDDNDRWSVRAWIRRWALHRPARIWVMAGAHAMDFNRWTGNGYWAPQDYRACYARLELEQDPAPGLTLLAGCDGGYAREGTASMSPYFSYYGGAVWGWRGLRLEGRGGHADTNLETGRGYKRTYAGLAVGAAF